MKLPLPETADFKTVLQGRLIATLNEPLGDLPAGAIVSYSLADIAAGRPAAPELVMAPTASQAIEEVAATDHVLWVKALDDVSGKLFALTRGSDGRWSSRAMPLAANSTIHLLQTSDKNDLAFAEVEGMLTPPTLVRGDARRGADQGAKPAGQVRRQRL